MPIFHDQLGKRFVREDLTGLRWRVGAYAIIQNERSEYLVLEPGWRKSWEFPGGGVEDGETLEEAIRREVSEETGYEVAEVSVAPLAIDEQWFMMPDGTPVHHLGLYFTATITNAPQRPELINKADRPDEVARLEWKQLEELNHDNCHFVIHAALESLKQEGL